MMMMMMVMKIDDDDSEDSGSGGILQEISREFVFLLKTQSWDSHETAPLLHLRHTAITLSPRGFPSTRCICDCVGR
jgi:hypothetical protein